MKELIEAINHFKNQKEELHNTKQNPQKLDYELRLELMLSALEEVGIDRNSCKVEQVIRGSALYPKIDFKIENYDFILIMQNGQELSLRHKYKQVVMKNPLSEFNKYSLKRHLIEMAVK
ncbi:hypothetical protein PN459_21505 [Microcystis aeruginosa CS-567/02-A1]|uniref:hypothetical protein n=1 Tax=Microcystis aeruginosa TaxID=1126 RepID=UPI00232BCA40|nr:hypothetical protein [Microcystis aeruginosa]MDB9402532.1 hypothetical protein [Microcystis aeruginosa CS-567/02-A1]